MAERIIAADSSVSNPAPSRDAIHAFLAETIRTDIHLVALSEPDQSHGMWFDNNAAAAADWAAAYSQAGWNVYWTVNTVAPGTQSKPRKDQIAHARFVHADIDPPKGVLEWDRAGALARLVAMRPSFIIDSGNGWQGLWRLAAPSAAIPLVEGVNRGAIAAVGADPACWNVDRLLRLPGTVNYPNAVKRAAGRIVSAAALHTPDSGAAYDLTALFAPTAPAAPREAVGVGAYVLLDPDDLVPPPGERLRAMIDRDGQPDRSVHCSAVAREMTSSGYPPEAVMGILMNPGNAVHAHVRDAPYPERAARRAMESGAASSPAAAFAVAPVLPAAASAEPVPQDPKQRIHGDAYILPGQMLDFFDGCVWVEDEDKIWVTDKMLNQSRFNGRFSGYFFPMDPSGAGKPEKNAWDAFMHSQIVKRPSVDSTCFRPEAASGAIIETEGLRLVNTYVPIETHRIAGDPAPFLDFLGRILPVERDRRILLSYLAAITQNPGRKFQWWPVIQGTKGNGKSAISTIMQHAVGERYSHLPNVAKMARNGINFNAWIHKRLFVGLEEVYAANRRDFLEEFKPYVTNTRISIERKGVDEVTGENCCNGIALTNHRDGVPIDDDERRYAIFFTAQQEAADLVRDGMDGDYFPHFYNWLDGRGTYAHLGENYGLAVCNNFLRTYAVEAEFNPAAGCVRAPQTSSYGQAIRASLGSVEQEIIEAVEQGEPGFCGGWISSLYLHGLLERLRIKVPRNKRPDLLRTMGYVPHPGIPNGSRPNAPIAPDGKRPVLYIRREHSTMALKDPAEIIKAYSDAQNEAISGATVLAFKRPA